MKQSSRSSIIVLVRQSAPLLFQTVRRRKWHLFSAALLLGISKAASLVPPTSTRYIIDDVIGKAQYALLVPLAGGILGAAVVQALASLLMTRVFVQEGQRSVATLRETLQAHVLRLPVSFFDGHSTGSLAARIMTDPEGVKNAVSASMLDFFGAVVTACFATVTLVGISFELTVIVFCGILLLCLPVKFYMRKVEPLFREKTTTVNAIVGRLTETLGGIRVVKCYGAEQREMQRFSSSIAQLLTVLLRGSTTTARLSCAITLMTSVLSTTILVLGVRGVLSHELTVGQLVMFTSLLGFVVSPVMQIANMGTQFTEALVGLDRVQELLMLETENNDRHSPVCLVHSRGDVVLDNVSFGYRSGRLVLRDISLHAPEGSVTAIVGASGSGKSTLVGLVAGFNRPTSGRLLFDDIDVTTLAIESYRRHVGIVLQEGFLFDGTVRENILLGKPDATTTEYIHACEIAGLIPLIDSWEAGHDTMVGERGFRLSGGQRQRIAIARALVANPQVLILDEATSNLDCHSECAIQSALFELMKHRTTFVISHRISTVAHADQIIVLSNGRIAEAGTHADLVAGQGEYYRLSQAQSIPAMSAIL